MSTILDDLTTFHDANWNGWHPTPPGTAKLEPQGPENDREFYVTNTSEAVHELGLSKSYAFTEGVEYLVSFDYKILSETDIVVLAGVLEQATGPHPPSLSWKKLTVPLPFLTEHGGTHPITIRFWSRSAGNEPHRYDLDNIHVRSVHE